MAGFDPPIRVPAGLAVRLALTVVLAVALAGGWATHAWAGVNRGALDARFGSGGFSTVSVGTWSGAAATVVQPDGAVVTAGEALVDGEDVILATRMGSDGALDPTFGSNGVVTIRIGAAAGVDSGAGLLVEADGDLLIAGTGDIQGRQELVAVELDPDGRPVASFGNDGIAAVPAGTAAYANAIALVAGGRIVLSGTDRTAGVTHFVTAELNSDGSVTTAFGAHGLVELPQQGADWGMVVQPDGAIVLAGQQTVNARQAYMMARLLPSGDLDPTFGRGGVVTLPIGTSAAGYAIGLRPDGDIIVTGDATDGQPVIATAALRPNGALDGGFGDQGVAEFRGSSVNAMMIDGEGRILLAGCGAALGRLNADGSIDTSFGHGGVVVYADGVNAAANGIAFDPSTGSVVLAGATHLDQRLSILVMRIDVPGMSAPTPPATMPPAPSAPAASATPIHATPVTGQPARHPPRVVTRRPRTHKTTGRTLRRRARSQRNRHTTAVRRGRAAPARTRRSSRPRNAAR